MLSGWWLGGRMRRIAAKDYIPGLGLLHKPNLSFEDKKYDV
jgi:hypothetical protein